MNPPPKDPDREKKAALRRQWREVLARGHTRDTIKNETICKLLAADSKVRSARAIALFASRSWEVDLTPLWSLRPEACAFPRIIPGTRGMEFFRVQSLGDLAPGSFDIFEPPQIASCRVDSWDESDIILVPGFYFDSQGHRIGGGLGFYDRFLKGKRVDTLGICWSEQWQKETIFPAMPHDISVRRICTEQGIFEIGTR